MTSITSPQPHRAARQSGVSSKFCVGLIARRLHRGFALLAILGSAAIVFSASQAVFAAPAPDNHPPGHANSDANLLRNKERTRLFATLKSAPDEPTGRQAEDAIWRFWLKGSDEATNRIVSDAMSARDSYNWDKALDLLNEAVRRDPNFAEAWSQRGFIHFLKGNLEKSLADIEKTLALEPKHFGALSGKAHIFMRQGRSSLMHDALKRAVAIHPWLKERHMLPVDEQPLRTRPPHPSSQSL